jgi:ketosteroid isomerase-like protein
VEQQLKKLEIQWANAGVKKDLAVIDRLLADDFITTDPQGEVFTRAEEIAFLKTGEDVVSYAALRDVKVRVYGDAAVVTYVYQAQETLKGRDVSGTSRWTDTWVKRGGSWRCVASHGSMITRP